MPGGAGGVCAARVADARGAIAGVEQAKLGLARAHRGQVEHVAIAGRAVADAAFAGHAVPRLVAGLGGSLPNRNAFS